MAYCRMVDDSDVYAFPTKRGFECSSCEVVFESPQELHAHLLQHRHDGDKVPDRAFELLAEDARKWLAGLAPSTATL